MTTMTLQPSEFRLESVKYLAAQELADHVMAPVSGQESESVSSGAFEGLAGLLQPTPDPTVYDALAFAARRMTGDEAAWLLAPDDRDWLVLGRSLSSVALAEPFDPFSQLRVAPLTSDGTTYGALAFWPAKADDEPHGLEAAFEHALTAALRTRRELDESKHLSATDPLTELPNRRALDASFGRLIALARRNQRPLSVLMIDLDHFKRVNDAHGHDAGDEVLKAFARMLLEGLRESDMPVRYGGEEFLVVLPETGTREAMEVAEKLRITTQRLAIPTPTGVIHPTISVGVASLLTHDTPESLVTRADKAMYRAKAEGRNRCRIEATS